MAAFLSSVFADFKAVVLSQMDSSQITPTSHRSSIKKWMRDWEATNAACRKPEKRPPWQVPILSKQIWWALKSDHEAVNTLFSIEEHRKELIKPKYARREAPSKITTGTAGHLPSQPNSCCLHVCKWLEIRTDKLRHLLFLNTAFSTISKWKMYLIRWYN